MSQLIKKRIDAKKASSAISGEKRDYELDVVPTRYEKGNAFARAMLAGLAQIHIDVRVALIALSGRRGLSEYYVSETIERVGTYGGATSIDDWNPLSRKELRRLQQKQNQH